MINGVQHIAIIVSSLKCVEFYTKLGFLEIMRKERPHDIVVILKGYDINLELFVDPNHPARIIEPESLGLRHLALGVGSIEEVIGRFECSPIKTDWFGNRYVITKDPDGNPIELCES